ncbi:hypothetical protein [Hubei diptera virus 18]|uniref:hypothetical protein n=1 Tax=Hubei diptera virus 18 TaxID=1922879 RepID=UPI00090AA3FB|nr:hypothetical protein [Hubei diptera virus 18]APG78226.1 hypothetical protein [Hubei diptera virus 18]APG78264.1 hypothetical protein [Hubei diptera virus 18]
MSRYNFNRGAPRGRGGQWRAPQNNNYDAGYYQNQNQNNRSNNNYPENNSYMYEAPQTSGRGRGRGGYRRGGISNDPKVNVRNPLDAKDPVAQGKPASMPTGQHLSKTNSELKNDPLYLEAFFPSPSEELVPLPEELNHFTGFDGLSSIINESYDNFCSHSLNFKRSVSLSSYAYYISVFCWARVLHLKRLNKYRLTTNEIEFVDMIYNQGNYLLPKSVTLYLSGFGNFTIPSSVESKFNTKPYSYDDAGYFVNFAEEFYTVTSYPCISIFAERIMRDMAFTENNRVGEAWSPNDIEQEWNTRCLGYAPSVELPSLQLQILNMAGISSENFPSDCEGLLINIRLLNSIQKYLLEIPSFESGPIPANLTGSLGQFVVEEVVENAVALDAIDNIGSASFITKSPLSCPGSLSYLGGSFLYRVAKKALPLNKIKFFFPYTINDINQLDINRLDTLNHGWSPLLENIYHYSNVQFKPILRLKKFCSIDVKPTSV